MVGVVTAPHIRGDSRSRTCSDTQRFYRPPQLSGVGVSPSTYSDVNNQLGLSATAYLSMGCSPEAPTPGNSPTPEASLTLASGLRHHDTHPYPRVQGVRYVGCSPPSPQSRLTGCPAARTCTHPRSARPRTDLHRRPPAERQVLHLLSYQGTAGRSLLPVAVSPGRSTPVLGGDMSIEVCASHLPHEKPA